MKRYIKAAAAVVLILVFLFTLSGCKGGINRDDAKAKINSFFDAAQAEDYELAATYLHPDVKVDLKSFFETLKTEKNVDFSYGVEIIKYTGFSYSYYISTVDGSSYALDMLVRVGDKKISMNIETVKNHKGYGIYNFQANV